MLIRKIFISLQNPKTLNGVMGITYSYLPMEILNRGIQPRVEMIVLLPLMVLIKKSVRNILVSTFKK